MKTAMSSLFKRSKATAREIDEELRFHLELLTQEHLRQGMSVDEAKDAAVKRFGNMERIKDQCLDIGRRTHPFLVAVKYCLILMFFAGVVVRILGTDLSIRTLGQLLIAVPILGGLLLYVRGLSPSSFASRPETVSPLGLNENVEPLFTEYDQQMLTPTKHRASYFR